MTPTIPINQCPTCGSDQIVLVVRDLLRQYQGEMYTVPAVKFYECPVCGERVYDREAMQKIAAYSPAYQANVVKQVVAVG
jgi:YgiT-type zinc finger domain-containing protein